MEPNAVVNSKTGSPLWVKIAAAPLFFIGLFSFIAAFLSGLTYSNLNSFLLGVLMVISMICGFLFVIGGYKLLVLKKSAPRFLIIVCVFWVFNNYVYMVLSYLDQCHPYHGCTPNFMESLRISIYQGDGGLVYLAFPLLMALIIIYPVYRNKHLFVR